MKTIIWTRRGYPGVFCTGACESDRGTHRLQRRACVSMRVDIRYICDCKKERR